jgi:2-polyprenyl-3-methyl-5-hydroxy-6-metoxy-1,4-benzoquinol methylase
MAVVAKCLRGQTIEAEHRAYFMAQFGSTREFWRRFARQPSFAGKRVLEVGCGHGALALGAANQGASVLAVDLDRERVEFAERQRLDPHATGSVKFCCVDLAELAPHGEFDVAVSKDTFEHVDDVPNMARLIHDALKPGGELWAGFSPLYFSPHGDHGRTGLPTWAHAFLPARVVLRAAARHNAHPVKRLSDIGLNGLTAPEFLAAFARAGFQPDSIIYNAGGKRGMAAFSRLRQLPGVSRYFTIGLYGVFRKP